MGHYPALRYGVGPVGKEMTSDDSKREETSRAVGPAALSSLPVAER